MRRKSPKTHQEPPGSWTSGEGGLAPFDPLAFCPSGIVCGSLNFQASSGATHLPCHGLKVESVPSKEPKEKMRPICPHAQSGKSVFFYRRKQPGAMRKRAQQGRQLCTRGIPKGAALGAPLVTFPATGKSPGCRAERLQVGAGTAVPAKTPGCRAERPL